MSNNSLKILPFGGLGEIGMNMMAIAYGDDAVLVDAGLMFPDQSMPGVDIVIPEIQPIFDLGWNIAGIVLTHGHEDHIGGVPFVLEKMSIPVYATRLTMGLLENKLVEHGLINETERHVITPSQPFQVGPFRFTGLSMCHSVADSVGLVIETPVGTVVHSGDFKIDPDPIDGRTCDLAGLEAAAAAGVLLLLADSTNVENPGSAGSESLVGPELMRIFREAPGRVLIATFSSSTHRIQQILRLSHEAGRKVVPVGRSMEVNIRIASELGYLNVPPDLLVDMKDAEQLDDTEVTILSTGSQGEPLSALSLMAAARHKYLGVKPGDTLILSSRFIPGNERAITQIINDFFRQGARVHYEKTAPVHVSGHAGREELARLIELVRPKFFVPIHGEYRHLQLHGELAVNLGTPEQGVVVAQDGDLIEVSPDAIAVVDHVDVGKIFVDGKGLGDVGNDVLRDRRVLSEVGVVCVALAVDAETGKLLSGPKLCSRGLTYHEVEPGLLEPARTAVGRLLEESAPRSPDEWERAREDIRLLIRRHMNRELGRKPLVQTLIVEV